MYFAKNVLIRRNSTQENFTAYPNPNNGKLYINIEPNKIKYLELINFQGQTVFNYTITNPEVIIEIPESIANGIYFIKCEGIIYRSEPILLIR